MSKIESNSFLRGFLTVFQPMSPLFPVSSPKRAYTKNDGFMLDAEKLWGDWASVGAYIDTSVSDYEREQSEKDRNQ